MLLPLLGISISLRPQHHHRGCIAHPERLLLGLLLPAMDHPRPALADMPRTIHPTLVEALRIRTISHRGRRQSIEPAAIRTAPTVLPMLAGTLQDHPRLDRTGPLPEECPIVSTTSSNSNSTTVLCIARSTTHQTAKARRDQWGSMQPTIIRILLHMVIHRPECQPSDLMKDPHTTIPQVDRIRYDISLSLPPSFHIHSSLTLSLLFCLFVSLTMFFFFF